MQRASERARNYGNKSGGIRNWLSGSNLNRVTLNVNFCYGSGGMSIAVC